MKTQLIRLLAALAVIATAKCAFAQGTAFTYQGRLFDNTNPANGNYALKFTLYADATSGMPALAGPVIVAPVAVSNGLFTVTIDFGSNPNPFTGPARWLQIDSASNSASPIFIPMNPRQQLTPAPYAIFAATASNLSGTLPTGQLSGTVLNSQLANNGITINAGIGLSGGGTVPLGGSTTLANVGVLSVIGNADITANTATGGAIILGDTATSANTPGTIVKRDGAGGFSGGNLTLNGNVILPATTAAAGIIYASSSTLMHSYGVSNFFGGAGAGNLTMSGAYNTGIGAGALANDTTGFNNTANGFQALFSNTSGNGNTASGYASLDNNTSGTINTAIGSEALSANRTGNNNIALGFGAGINVVSDNNIEIGNLGTKSDDDIIRIGSIQTQAFIAGTITGDGSGLTGVNATALNGLKATNFWQTGGNSGTTPGVNFLGTTDQQPLELWVGNMRVFRLEPSPYPNVVGGGGTSVSISGGLDGGATIGGGFSNSITAGFGTIAGGLQNIASGAGATVGGGGTDGITYGGQGNTAGGAASTIGGGVANTVSVNSPYATIGGGVSNTASRNQSTVSGGNGNFAGGNGASVGGGAFNEATSDYGTVAGGKQNHATGLYATIPGGYANLAAGEYSFAGGQQAGAGFNGDFVWADSQNAEFDSTGSDQFCVRAQGGVQLDNSTSVFFGSQTRQMLNLYGTTYGIGVQPGTEYFRVPPEAGFAWYEGGGYVDGAVNPGPGGSELMYLDPLGNLSCRGDVLANFNSSCDRALKENFTPVEACEVLEKVVTLPITAWQFKREPTVRHIGPMAQDWYATFNVGPDDKHIAVVDEGGVALAAIQGLNQKLQERDQKLEADVMDKAARIAQLEAEVSELRSAQRQAMADWEARFNKLQKNIARITDKSENTLTAMSAASGEK